MEKKIVIILPTYNERDNLAGIIRDIFALGVPGVHVLVVDDNSPDGTGRIADELARTENRLSVLHRPHKEGLGRAYIAGFREAMGDPDVEFIFEMDADFSHQPKYIADFLKEAQTADFVLGSRYMAGGGVENWGWMRHAISRTANWTIKHILGVKVSDLTGGYKCFHRRVLETLDLDAVQSNGYNFQIELTYKALKAGFRAAEVPIVFLERRSGQSKFSVKIMFESFWRVLRLRFRL